jgi:hypothetical protein
MHDVISGPGPLIVVMAAAADPTWTDVATAIGTVGAVVVSLGVALWSRVSAQRAIREQNERLAAEAQRRFYVETLETVAVLYAESKAVTGASLPTTISEPRILPGAAARRKLQVFARALPDDCATLLRDAIGVGNSEKGEKKLRDFKARYQPRGGDVDLEEEVYVELAEDISRLSTPIPAPTHEGWWRRLRFRRA